MIDSCCVALHEPTEAPKVIRVRVRQTCECDPTRKRSVSEFAHEIQHGVAVARVVRLRTTMTTPTRPSGRSTTTPSPSPGPTPTTFNFCGSRCFAVIRSTICWALVFLHEQSDPRSLGGLPITRFKTLTERIECVVEASLMFWINFASFNFRANSLISMSASSRSRHNHTVTASPGRGCEFSPSIRSQRSIGTRKARPLGLSKPVSEGLQTLRRPRRTSQEFARLDGRPLGRWGTHRHEGLRMIAETKGPVRRPHWDLMNKEGLRSEISWSVAGRAGLRSTFKLRRDEPRPASPPPESRLDPHVVGKRIDDQL